MKEETPPKTAEEIKTAFAAISRAVGFYRSCCLSGENPTPATDNDFLFPYREAVVTLEAALASTPTSKQEGEEWRTTGYDYVQDEYWNGKTVTTDEAATQQEGEADAIKILLHCIESMVENIRNGGAERAMEHGASVLARHKHLLKLSTTQQEGRMEEAVSPKEESYSLENVILLFKKFLPKQIAADNEKQVAMYDAYYSLKALAATIPNKEAAEEIEVCIKPNCKCSAIAESKNGGEPLKYGYPCLANDGSDKNALKREPEESNDDEFLNFLNKEMTLDASDIGDRKTIERVKWYYSTFFAASIPPNKGKEAEGHEYAYGSGMSEHEACVQLNTKRYYKEEWPAHIWEQLPHKYIETKEPEE